MAGQRKIGFELLEVGYRRQGGFRRGVPVAMAVAGCGEEAEGVCEESLSVSLALSLFWFWM